MDTIETSRLILRPFTMEDAADVYDYAKDPRVGPIAGWPAHQSIEESRTIIQTVFASDGVAAITLKENGRVVGSVGFVDRYPAGKIVGCPDNEIGYGLHPGYWGQGLVPEAVEAMLRWGFESRGYRRIWCGHYAGNWRSARVINKCGFHYQFAVTEYVAAMDERRRSYEYVQTAEEWRERISGTV
ncbi:MAG: GNAT family N-acetyltransferase [Oscillibacter sp.]|jgi:RimJ/RimL family protein N-acetyltransferase|nr:GNAT family N-acetyltransferase [Oscillibacter sp.]